MGNKPSKRQIYMQETRVKCIVMLAERGLHTAKLGTQNANLEKVICKITGWKPKGQGEAFATVERYVLEGCSQGTAPDGQKAEPSTVNLMKQKPYRPGRDIAAAMERLQGFPKPANMVSNVPLTAMDFR